MTGILETFIKQRPLVEDSDGLSGTASSDEVGDVKVDDASVFIARFTNGWSNRYI